jgi:glutamate dehydrogenase (NAD(P)+)
MAPDMNTNAQTMAWMMDAWGQKHGHQPGIVTGKPIELGGSKGREAATGRGCLMVVNEAVRDADRSPEDLTMAIQGFGNVGSWMARLAHAEGYRVVGVSDVNGGVYNGDGLNIPSVLEHVREAGTVAGYPQAEDLGDDSILELDVDILVPAALGGVIDKTNADSIRAWLVAEAANHPVTPVADATLQERGLTVLPDILANAGGVTVSYFEWTQNIQQFHWEEDRVNRELYDHMTQAYQRVRDYARAKDISLRRAAFALAVERVAETAHLRGYV